VYAEMKFRQQHFTSKKNVGLQAMQSFQTDSSGSAKM
jgi:hypothetical protein